MKTIDNYINEKLVLNKQSQVTKEKVNPNDPANFKVGDILCGTWGYNMVIPAFYKIIKKTNKTFVLKELKEKLVSGHYNGNFEVVATDKFENDKEIKVRPNKINRLVITNKRLSLSLWDGEPIWGNDMD